MGNYFSIIDFGAYPAADDNTQAIQAAIDVCEQNGGGVVEIPAGVYKTGTLKLCSNLTVYLAPGAVLQGSSDMRDYKSFGYTHNEFGDVLALFYAENCSNISFTGDGKIDFNGRSFFDMSHPHSKDVNINELTLEQREQFDVAYEIRPNQMMFFAKCVNIKVKDIYLYDAACWGIVFSDCKQIYITGIKIRNSFRIPNSDGIHLSSCENVIISDCDIISGDDCIAVTGIDGWEIPSANIVITNCIFCSSSAAVRLGYWHSKVQKVRISNCIMYQCTRGICIMSCEKGLVEDVGVSNVSIQTTSRAGGWWGIGEPIYIMALPHVVNNHRDYAPKELANDVNVKNVVFRDINIKAVNPIVMVGTNNIQNIRFYNTEYWAVDHLNEEYFGDALDLKPSTEIRLKNGKSYWGYFEGVIHLNIDDIRINDNRTHQENILECNVH